MRHFMRFGVSRFILPILAASVVALGQADAQTKPARGELFVIPASGGYGISECFSPGAACGKVVADAWCESHGRGPSLAFGRGGDVTASFAASTRPAQKIEIDDIVVSCSD